MSYLNRAFVETLKFAEGLDNIKSLNFDDWGTTIYKNESYVRKEVSGQKWENNRPIYSALGNNPISTQ